MEVKWLKSKRSLRVLIALFDYDKIDVQVGEGQGSGVPLIIVIKELNVMGTGVTYKT